MLLKYFYDKHLAHASYMVGCQKTGEALIVDPCRDISAYLKTAEQENMTIVGAAETHIHADFVSGARELAEQTGARLYLSNEGDENWKYAFADQYTHQLLKDGDTFMIGNIRFEVMHTPGHTPEHVSYLVTDRGGGADRPMGIFTGDFVFVGSVGRPDLLEKAAGIANTSIEGARQMFESLQRFKTLPDYLQIWPAHGAGSACGKGLGAIPSSTVGYEKLFNPALQYDNPGDFTEMLLEGQPEPPKYFAVMKRVNKEGPEILNGYTIPPRLAPSKLEKIVSEGHQVVDTAAADSFAKAHVPGTINISKGNLASWAGWVVDYERPLYLIGDSNAIDQVIRILAEIGIDQIAGFFDAEEVTTAGLATESYRVRQAKELADQILQNEVTLIDVRAQTEWDEGHLPHANHMMLGYLADHAENFFNGKPIVVQCRTGSRSAIGASILQSKGAQNVINMAGGITAWVDAGLPIET